MTPDAAPPAARYHCVIVANGRPEHRTYTGAAALVQDLKDLYATVLEDGDTDTRVFVFAGARLRISGTDNRVLTLPDGHAVPLTEAAAEETDHLLSVGDRTGRRRT